MNDGNGEQVMDTLYPWLLHPSQNSCQKEGYFQLFTPWSSIGSMIEITETIKEKGEISKRREIPLRKTKEGRREEKKEEIKAMEEDSHFVPLPLEEITKVMIVMSGEWKRKAVKERICDDEESSSSSSSSMPNERKVHAKEWMNWTRESREKKEKWPRANIVFKIGSERSDHPARRRLECVLHSDYARRHLLKGP